MKIAIIFILFFGFTNCNSQNISHKNVSSKDSIFIRMQKFKKIKNLKTNQEKPFVIEIGDSIHFNNKSYYKIVFPYFDNLYLAKSNDTIYSLSGNPKMVYNESVFFIMNGNNIKLLGYPFEGYKCTVNTKNDSINENIYYLSCYQSYPYLNITNFDDFFELKEITFSDYRALISLVVRERKTENYFKLETPKDD